ncbi:hypothetical protein C2845_PM15G12500 [Panicum miliaceum]|uniref:Uncharacterized protein n=1 Tax=Panicum miliaceum TaxID=4540 RepID=A0A3L6Q945_PANMI|nr:hypothetical protein C2845_PM15G12500 [Panicum miliaceum]
MKHPTGTPCAAAGQFQKQRRGRERASAIEVSPLARRARTRATGLVIACHAADDGAAAAGRAPRPAAPVRGAGHREPGGRGRRGRGRGGAAGARTRCGAGEKAAVGAVAALAVARIAAMVGMARAQELTALAVASDADRGDGPTQDFAARETRVGPVVLALLLYSFSDFRVLYESQASRE